MRTLLCLFAMQGIEVTPSPAEAGAPVLVRLHDAASRPLAGVTVRRRSGAAAEQEVGVTDAGGSLRLVAGDTGDHVYFVDLGEVRVMTTHKVVPPVPRWLYAAIGVPLGLVFLWRNLRLRPAPIRR